MWIDLVGRQQVGVWVGILDGPNSLNGSRGVDSSFRVLMAMSKVS